MYVRKIFTCVGFHGNHRPPPFTNPFPGPLFISDRGQRLMAGAHKTTSHVSDAGALRSQTFRIREHERVSPNKNDKSPPRSITKTSERHSFSSSIHPKACSGIHCTRGDTLSCDHCWMKSMGPPLWTGWLLVVHLKKHLVNQTKLTLNSADRLSLVEIFV